MTAGKALQYFIYFLIFPGWIAQNEMNMISMDKRIITVQDPVQIQHVFRQPGMPVIL